MVNKEQKKVLLETESASNMSSSSNRCVSTNPSGLSSRLPPSSEGAPETSEGEAAEEAEEEDGEIVHFSHPEHRLARFDFPYLFLCMGCKEYGAGKRFMCQACGFQLHEFCALAPPSLHDHPFHPKHPHLLFFAKPAGARRADHHLRLLK